MGCRIRKKGVGLPRFSTFFMKSPCIFPMQNAKCFRVMQNPKEFSLKECSSCLGLRRRASGNTSRLASFARERPTGWQFPSGSEAEGAHTTFRRGKGNRMHMFSQENFTYLHKKAYFCIQNHTKLQKNEKPQKPMSGTGLGNSGMLRCPRRLCPASGKTGSAKVGGRNGSAP